MPRFMDLAREPRALGLLCAGTAVALGLCYLLMAGAPTRHLAINGAAFLVGLAAYATIVGPRWRLGAAEAALLPALSLVLLATALLARPVEGAARWVAIGPLSLQVSLILLPAMITAFARAPDRAGAVGMAIAALALALQPDRAMAGVLAAGLAMLALRRPEPWVLAALAAAIGAFAAALALPDVLPAVPYVDEVFYTAFDVHPLAGGAVIVGAALLLLPVLIGRGEKSGTAAVFGATWGAVILAAALGNYPTPVVGYGGSAIVGYLLSLALLPRIRAARPVGDEIATDAGQEGADGRALAAALP